MCPPEPVGTALYRSTMAWADAHPNRHTGELMRQEWTPTPWMVDWYTGGNHAWVERELEIQAWCRERYGDQSWPMGDRSGTWRRGGATVNGWTWMGFATEAQMLEFCAAWPIPEGAPRKELGG